MIEFLLVPEDIVKPVIIVTTDVVSLIGSSQISKNNKLDGTSNVIS